MSFNQDKSYTCVSNLKIFPKIGETGRQINILRSLYPTDNRMKNLYQIEGIEDSNVLKYMKLVTNI